MRAITFDDIFGLALGDNRIHGNEDRHPERHAMIVFRVRDMDRTEARRMMLIGVPVLATAWIGTLERGPVFYLGFFLVVMLLYTYFYGCAFRLFNVAATPGRKLRFYLGVIVAEAICIALAVGIHALLN